MEVSDALIEQRYRLLRPLGEGGQARTYLAHDAKSGEQVVLKVLLMARASDWKSIELFEREATALKNLDHPAIPRYIDAFYLESAGFCLAQEYLPGGSLLAAWKASGELFDEKNIRELLAEVLKILVYLQGFSPPIIHRDIKPSNLMLSADAGRVYSLIDFGAVQRIAQDSVGGSTVVGTSGYMPPEQLMGRAQPASDIYALGATCVFLASGINPSELPHKRMKLQFREYVDLSARLISILERMLEPEIDHRFASAREVLDALGAPERDPLPTKVVSPTQALATREVALRERLANPPMLAPKSRVKLANRRLEIVLPIYALFPIGQLFCGIGLIWAGLGTLWFRGSMPSLVWLGIILFISGIYLAARSLATFSGTGQDTLTISEAWVKYRRAKLRPDGSLFPGKPRKRVVMSLRALEHCYLELGSANPKGVRKKGIILNDRNGHRVVFGGHDIETHGSDGARDSESQMGLDDEELRWLFEIIQAHLQIVADPEPSTPEN